MLTLRPTGLSQPPARPAKHIFNPAGFVIVILLLTFNGVWASEARWTDRMVVRA
jgi:hypothetical protein